jgi:hypothetical protein
MFYVRLAEHQENTTERTSSKIYIYEKLVVLPYSHGIKGEIFALHPLIDTSLFQEKCKNLK